MRLMFQESHTRLRPHGPYLEADVVRDRRLTSLRIDLRESGASWVDEPFVEFTNGPGRLSRVGSPTTSTSSADLW